jgi:hypothetical protein
LAIHYLSNSFYWNILAVIQLLGKGDKKCFGDQVGTKRWKTFNDHKVRRGNEERRRGNENVLWGDGVKGVEKQTVYKRQWKKF